MEIILTETIKGLGVLGDKVSVNRGYYRNFLGPQGKAMMLTKDNLTQFDARKAEFEAAESERLATAKAQSVHVDSKIEFSVRASDEGKLFGSINATDIAYKLSNDQLRLEKRNVELKEGAIRNVGIYHAQIFLHPEVSIDVEIWVEAPNAPISKFVKTQQAETALRLTQLAILPPAMIPRVMQQVNQQVKQHQLKIK